MSALAVPRAALQATGNRFGRLGLALLLLLLLGVPLSLGLAVHARAGFISLAALGFVIVMSGWMGLCSSVLQQNHPQLARLLPAHVARLRGTLIAGWLLLVGAGVLGSLALRGGPLAFGLPVAALSLLLAGALRWPLLWVLMWLPGLSPLLLREPVLRSLWDALLALGGAQPWLTLAVALLLGLAALARMIGDGGPAHEARYRRMLTWRKAFRLQGQTNLDWRQGSLLDRAQALTRGVYLRVLHRHTARPRPGFGRFALVLGPQGHWAGHLGALPVLVGIVCAVVAGLWLAGMTGRGGARAAEGLGNAGFGGLSYLMSVLQQTRAAMISTRQEQGLLCLLPGLPRGAALNRRLALWLMGQFLLQWALVFGLLALILGAWPQTYPTLFAFALAALPAGLWLWTDWSRAQAPTGLPIGLLYLLPMLLGALGMYALRAGWLTPAALALCVLGPTLPLAWWRWQRALRAPMALPAGRG